MNVLITLVSVGNDAGPFDLYSDVDGYVTAFETDVTKEQLLVGYISTSVPDGTTFIKITSTDDVCEGSIIIALDFSSTTTTSTTISTTTTTTTFAPNIFGLLYNWYAAANPLLPPTADRVWRVPSFDDWDDLVDSVVNTRPLKSTGNITCSPYSCGLWEISTNPASMEGTNTSGFNINPSGVVGNTGISSSRYAYANFWTSEERTPNTSLGVYCNFSYGGSTMYSSTSYYLKNYGFDIRLISDDTSGYSMGDEGTLTDYDGNVYPVKMMPDGKLWTLENLRVQHYNDGSVIPVCTGDVGDPVDWSTTTDGAIHTFNAPPVYTHTYLSSASSIYPTDVCSISGTLGTLYSKVEVLAVNDYLYITYAVAAPFDGSSRYWKVFNDGDYYSMQIDSAGKILDMNICI